MKRRQSGASLLVVLVLLTVLLLGGLSMSRGSANGSLIAGNTAYRAAALEASEVGLADAFAQIGALAAEDTNDAAHGYYATRQADDAGAAGVPAVTWDDMPSTTVGGYAVQRVVDRLCTVAPVTDAASQCLIRLVPSDSSKKAGGVSLPPQIGKQYRVTVRVTGPHDTQVIVQDLVVR